MTPTHRPHSDLPADQRTAREEAVRRLCTADAGFVLCVGKRPTQSQGKAGAPVRPPAEEVIAHLRASPSHLVGIALETIGCAVIDFDGDLHDEQASWVKAVSQGAPPLVIMRSMRGGHHVVYRCASGRRKPSAVKWELPCLASDATLKGDLLYPWGRLLLLPGDNVIALARQVLDAGGDKGAFDSEIADLFRPRAQGNVPDMLARLRASDPHTRNETLNNAVYQVVGASTGMHQGGPVERAFAAVALATGNDDERHVMSTINSARDSKRAYLTGKGADGAPVVSVDGKQLTKTLITEGVCAEGLRRGLKVIGASLARVRDYGDAVCVKRPGQDEWAVMESSDQHWVQGQLRDRCLMTKQTKEGKVNVPYAASAQTWAELYQVVADDVRVDTIGDYLAECEAKHGAEFVGDDAPDRAHDALAEMPGLLWRVSEECADVARWAFPAMMVAAVGRHFRPGLKFDVMVVLASPPGKGKSTFVRALLPDEVRFGRKVSQGLNFAGTHLTGDRDRCEKLMGRMWAEFEELSPKGVDHDAFKAFVSRTEDTFRAPYERVARLRPRTCVLIGTTNNSQPLPRDPAGHRKFVLVRLDGMADACGNDDEADHVLKVMGEHRMRLYAAAVALYRYFDGRGDLHAVLSVPTELRDAVNRLASEGSEVDPLEQELIDLLEAVPSDIGYLTKQEIAEMSGRVRAVDGDYELPGRELSRAITNAVRALPGVWRPIQRVVRLLTPAGGKVSKRVYVRAGRQVGDGTDYDRDARRVELRIPHPNDAVRHHSHYD